MKTRLQLLGVEMPVRLGCTSGERAIPQTVKVDVVLEFALPPEGCKTDQLEQTVCYAQLGECLRKVAQAKEYQLVEHLAHEQWKAVREISGNQASLKVRVHKLWPPLGYANDGVVFEIEM